MENKIVFISGANRGLGLEIARQLGNLGTKVVPGATNEKSGQDAAS